MNFTINKNKRVIIFFIIVAITELIWILNSGGFYFIDDSCHYNFNRHFLSNLEGSVSTWSRIGRVLLYFIPAQLGIKGVQISSAIIFLITIYFAYRILEIKKIKYSEWVILAIGFQPVLFNISFTSLAELPAATLIIMSFYFFLKNKNVTAMILASLTFTFRTEMYFVAGLYFIYFLYKKNWKVLPYVIVGPLFWFLLSWIFTGNINSFFYNLGMHSRLPRIQEGIKWNHYLLMSPKTYGILQTLFFVIALFVILIKKRTSDFLFLILVTFGGIAGHTLAALDGLATTCSVGQIRYIAIVGPAFGIIATVGFSWFFELIKSKKILDILSVLVILILFLFGPLFVPFHVKYEIANISDKIAYLQKEKYPDYAVISDMHQLANALDESAAGDKTYKMMTKKNIEAFQKSIIVWESSLEGSPFVEDNVTLKYIESLSNVKLLDSVNVTIDHNWDYPIFYFYPQAPDYVKRFMEYMIAEQNCWEVIRIKTFIRN